MTAAGIAANLGGVALLTLPGLGLTELLAPLRGLPWPRRLGYAYLLGVAALGAILFAASHLAGVPLRRPAIMIAALAPAGLGLVVHLVRRRRRGLAEKPAAFSLRAGSPPLRQPPLQAPPLTPPSLSQPTADAALRPGHGGKSGAVAALRVSGAGRRQRRLWRLAAAVAVAAVLAGPLASALAGPLADWDGRMTWSALAAYVRHDGTVNAEVLRDPRWLVICPRYPPLLPLAQAAVQETFGAGQDDQYFRAAYVAFLGALLAVLYDGARRAAGQRAAAIAALFAALPPFLCYGPGGATSAYSDLPLAAFYGAGLVLLLIHRPHPTAGLAAGCLLAAVLLTKNEGEILAAAALLLAAARLWQRWRRPRSPGAAANRHLTWFAAAVAPVLAAAALLASWRAGIPDREEPHYFTGLHPGALLHAAQERLPWIAHEVLRLTFSDPAWLGFWAALPLVLLAGHRALRRPLARRLLLAGLVPPALGCAAYLIGTNLGDLIRATWPRFLLQALVPLAMVFACALGQLLRELRRPRRTAVETG